MTSFTNNNSSPMTSDIDLEQGVSTDQISHIENGKENRVLENGEYLIIAGTRYHRNEFMQAFGGTLNPGSAPAPSRKFGNAAPVGLFAFSITMIILGFCTCGVRGIGAPNVMVGCAIFGGGLCELIAGIWEIVAENTFAACVFLCFSCFWFSWSLLNLPLGIEKYYATEEEFAQAVGVFLMSWFIFCVLMTLCTLKATVAFFVMFVSLDLAVIFLAAGNFTGNPRLLVAGGAFCISTGLLGCWNGMAGVATPQSTYKWFIPVPIMMPGAHKAKMT
ncbi:Glyoxylate pathway regulator [Yarrowia sp. B02]|nr:Glyoxylate pathway regulator [Yarrowia sp. B02]